MLKEIKISITPEQEFFLKQFAELHYEESPENLATVNAFHVVEERVQSLPNQKPYFKPVAFFFIRKQAEKYIESQSHNLENPRVFTYSSGYGNNGEFNHFRQLLLAIGEKLNKQSESI